LSQKEQTHRNLRRAEEEAMKSGAVALLTLLVLVFVPAAYADGLGSAVNGGGHRACCPAYPDQMGPPFSVNAVEIANDGTASGLYNINNPNQGVLDFKGDVTSMWVSGNRALVCGVVREAKAPDQVGTGFAVAFTDNGNPSGPVPDFVSRTNVFIPPIYTQADCLGNAFLFLPLFTFSMTEGNITVSDAGA
jgi:hypothetical protein